jgi:glutamate racemase
VKIGIFDSGLGGLLIGQAIMEALPVYDYIYLGDTARVPYGNRSQEAIYKFTEQAVSYLLENDCKLIIIACNTASSEALRRIQQEYLPLHFPERRVLGVLIPAAEEAAQTSPGGKIGVLATSRTVSSQAFSNELLKLRPDAIVYQQAAPLLVPMIEAGAYHHIAPVLAEYLSPFTQTGIDTLILGCTHYPKIERLVAEMLPGIRIISQTKCIPPRLINYVNRHPEIETRLSTTSSREFQVTDLSHSFQEAANELFGQHVTLKKVAIDL